MRSTRPSGLGASRALARGLPPGFGSLWTAVAVDLVGFGIVIPILPLYATRYGASPAVIGLLLASFSVAQLVCAPLLGALSDRVGRRPVLLLSLVGTAVASLLTGLAGTLWLLFLARILDGASGASVSVAQAAALDNAPRRDHARLLGYLGAAFGLGFVAGPALAALSAVGGARAPFLVASAIAGLNTVVAYRRLPETLGRTGSEVPDASADVPPGGAGRATGAAVSVAVVFLAVTAFAAFEATFALLVHHRLGFGFSSTGGAFAFAGLVIVAVQVGVLPSAVGRLGDRGALRAGLALDAAGLLVLSWAHSVGWVLAALAVLSCGQGLVVPSAAACMARLVHVSRRGRALGAQQAAGGLARAVGPVAAGAAFGAIGAASPLIGAAALSAGALLLTLRLPLPAPVPASLGFVTDG